ncbi:mediator complex, subunit Med10 [Durotheca rogersii]|uniref:mediator complex, subunit Med10 n=1 Tax=Durotheca rogersii TaxID=419775 RepID=UPI00221F2B16|nr:mediator complex, subunit Med10 [Durotheca rogersii]KAI5864514.1 mediator complex, subunit Med10 [Durotheca rogersii]
MAPVARVDHDALEQQLKDTIQTLTNIMVQVTNYDATGSSASSAAGGGSARGVSSSSSRDVIASELRALSASLQAVHQRSAASLAPSPVPAAAALPHIPPELIQYVDNGRNPDIYTREFVELVRRGNQLLRGKQAAFAAFRDVLAGEMDRALPELRRDTARVLAATAGPASGTAAAAASRRT